jgi:CO/xanthine dehydrogenase FAD-binding subunit
VARRATGERTIPIADFFLGTMTTALAADECLTSVRFPLSPGRGRIGTGFQEVSARRSDFALVAVAVQLLIEDGVCRRASIALGGIGEVPVRALGAAEQLIGTRIEAPDLSRALARLDQEIEPQSDMHVSAAYRRRVVLELVERAVGEARAEASAGA